MYKKIMVPLDGSELAECVLSHVEAVSKGSRPSEIVFVRVVDPLPRGRVSAPFGEDLKRLELEDREKAQEYLEEVVKGINYKGIEFHVKVIVGKAAEELATYAEENHVDLIVMATHGHSGPSRWVFGSVAERILRSACVPVLMVRAPGCVVGI
jgi:nucleotide-binding universal stress UspA family protein